MLKYSLSESQQDLKFCPSGDEGLEGWQGLLKPVQNKEDWSWNFWSMIGQTFAELFLSAGRS